MVLIINQFVIISIHALREEGDCAPACLQIVRWKFQSTPSARRATVNESGKLTAYKFQSTPSARRATPVWQDATVEVKFQSTPSARRATSLVVSLHKLLEISIHALREEGDV